MSFVSILQTMIHFNEWSKRRHTLHRMILVVPFFAITILYRVLALSLILTFAGGQFGMIPIFGLLLTQVKISIHDIISNKLCQSFKIRNIFSINYATSK